MAKLGLFSTMTSTGSLQLVTTIARACREGRVPGAEVAFLFVNREPGESEVTDASVEKVETAFGFPVVRVSAVCFRREERQAARAAAKEGDEEPLWAWREAFYGSYCERLPPTDLDLLLGDMWIWGRKKCVDRCGLNLHPALPTGPLGKMWFDVIWDLVEADANESGVMLHRATAEVDEGPVAAYCRYSLRGPGLDELWAALPADAGERAALIARERELKRETQHPLFKRFRAVGLAREMPLMLETVRAVAEGRMLFSGGRVVDADGRPIEGGLDLTAEVERAVAVDATD